MESGNTGGEIAIIDPVADIVDELQLVARTAVNVTAEAI